MPSRSRKKDKGRARKAKAAAELQRWIANPNDSICNHGQSDATPEVYKQFIMLFYRLYTTAASTSTFAEAVQYALDVAYNKFPEALNNELYRDNIKKNIISNGVSSLLDPSRYHPRMALGCAAALMLIDSYSPSCPVPLGNFDQRDANQLLIHTDILMGCLRSLVKFFLNRIPCECLDDIYSQLKSTKPKMGSCLNCFKMGKRSSMFLCSGCERVTYCSKACQLEYVPRHKKHCKVWQSGGFTYDL